MAYIKVSPPILPKNIRNIISTLDMFERKGVWPSERPTVPIADEVSKIDSNKVIFSILHIMQPTVINTTKYETNIVIAFLIVWILIFL